MRLLQEEGTRGEEMPQEEDGGAAQDGGISRRGGRGGAGLHAWLPHSGVLGEAGSSLRNLLVGPQRLVSENLRVC